MLHKPVISTYGDNVYFNPGKELVAAKVQLIPAKEVQVGDWIAIHGEAFNVTLVYLYSQNSATQSFMTDDGLDRRFNGYFNLHKLNFE